MKLSFDYDDTLSRPEIARYASMLSKAGYDLWIVTARLPDYQAPSPRWNNDLWDTVEQLNIPKENVIFTGYFPKHQVFWDRNDFLWHLDDDLQELKTINALSTTVGIDSYAKDWQQQCNELL